MTFLRTTAAVSLLMALAACSGSGGGLGNILGGNPSNVQCNPGTQVQLARPAQGQSGAGTVNSIEIVTNGNTNVLSQSPASWYLQVQDSFGDPPIFSNTLTPVADPGGPHPYASDFYYSAGLGQSIPAGNTWTVSLLQGQPGIQGCTAYPVGTFSN